MKKIAFYTLGCKVNQSDTASMEKLFRDAGYEIVDFEEPADICLINTCVVTNMGQSKSRKIIHRAARRDPKPLIVVTGCYPQTSPDEVVHIDGVDLIIGNHWSRNGWEKARKKPPSMRSTTCRWDGNSKNWMRRWMPAGTGPS